MFSTAELRQQNVSKTSAKTSAREAVSNTNERTQHEQNLNLIRELKSELEYRRPVRWFDLADNTTTQQRPLASESEPIACERRARCGRRKRKDVHNMTEGKITVHHYSHVGAVRTVVYKGEEYVLLDDFCRALHLTPKDVSTRWKKDDIKRVPLDIRPANIVDVYHTDHNGVERVITSTR